MSRVLAAWPLIAPLVRAVDALLVGDVVDITPLLPIVRAARIAGYENAGVDVVDVTALADVLRRRPGILQHDGDELLVVDEDRGFFAPRRHRAARLLVDALIIGLESTKLRWGLRPTSAMLKTVFASPDEARAVLAAVAAVPGTIRVQPLPPPASLTPSPKLGNVHLVVGPAARRLQDMLSPAIRRLRVELALLGRRSGVVDDDDVYRGAAILDDTDPDCRAERDDKDADEGAVVDDGRCFVVDTARLQEELVDRRLRSLLTPLKKARATIVGIVDDDHLDLALNLTPKSIQLVVAGSATTTSPWFVDAGSGAIVVGDPDERVASLSVPSPLLVPDGVHWDDGAWRLQQAVCAARLAHPLPAPQTRSGDDLSALCAAAVAAMVMIPER